MGATRHTTLAPELAEVLQQFDRWRHERSGRGAIPEELWARATRLAAQHGIHKVARALRLDYVALKRRVVQAAIDDGVEPIHFVELPGTRATGSPLSASPMLPTEPERAPESIEPMGVRIELTAPDGACLRIFLPAGEREALREIASDFWRRSA